MQRQSKVTAPDDAVAMIEPGMIIGMGGFLTANRPMVLVDALIRKGVRNLTVTGPACSLETDILIGLGRVAAVITPHVGAEQYAPVAPFFAAAAQGGRLRVFEFDAALWAAGVRAAAQSLPFMPWIGGLGTSLSDLNPMIRRMRDPFQNLEVLAVAPIQPDVVLIHAAESDPYGNLRHVGAPFADGLMAVAGKHVIAQVDRLVPNESVRGNPRLTTVPGSCVNQVVLAPGGAHPFSSEAQYRLNPGWLRAYVAHARQLAARPAHEWEPQLLAFLANPGPGGRIGAPEPDFLAGQLALRRAGDDV